MNRAWLTGLTVAGVVGTGGAAMASVADSPSTEGLPTSAAAVLTQATTATSGAPTGTARTVTYQVGAAGTVAIEFGGSGATVNNAVPSAGWTLGTVMGSGAHVEIQFLDATQVVTFSADLVNGELIVSVSSVPVAGAAPDTSPAPITAVVISNVPSSAAPQPAAAVAPVVSIPEATAPTTAATPPATATTPATGYGAPQPVATTAPSGGTNDDDDDDEDEDEDEYEDREDDHEYEDEDHEDDYESEQNDD